MTTLTLNREPDGTASRTPRFGMLGAHPAGTGSGAAAGGAAAGAVAGALAGDQIAEAIDASAEEVYWRANYSSRPYVTAGATFNEYRPAYRYGVDAHRRFEGRPFEQVEAELMQDWDRVKGMSSLTWEDARHACHDSWQRISDFRNSDPR